MQYFSSKNTLSMLHVLSVDVYSPNDTRPRYTDAVVIDIYEPNDTRTACCDVVVIILSIFVE